jgi:hypothetical protein
MATATIKGLSVRGPLNILVYCAGRKYSPAAHGDEYIT